MKNNSKTSLGPSKEAHSSNKKLGMGDNYGTGVKNTMGKRRDSPSSAPVAPSKLGKAPKSIA